MDQPTITVYDRIDVRWHTEVTAFEGAQSKLNQLRLVDNRTGREENMPIDGAFIFI